MEEDTHVSSVDSFFIAQVKDFIAKETALVDPDDREGRFYVYQTALEMIINQCPTMSAILSSIEKCYLDVVEMHRHKTRAVIGDEAHLSRVINCQASIKHQEKRIAVLEETLRALTEEKGDLESKLASVEREITMKRDLYYPKPSTKKESPLDEADMKYFQLTAIDDESVAVDVDALEKRLSELNCIIEQANSDSSKAWIPISEYQKLQSKVQNLSEKRLEYARKCSTLYIRHERLRYAVTALREVTSSEGRVATVGEAILRTFKTFKPDKKESFLEFLLSLSEQAGNYRGENLGGEQAVNVAPDVDMSLAEWLKKTHKLLSNGSFKEAAETAASAPSGLLCNIATLEAFKTAAPESSKSETNLPVLFYLEAVLGPLTTKYVLSERFLAACVSVAVEYDCFWLLSSWVAKRRLPFSTNIVKFFLSNGQARYYALAESLCRSALFEYPSSEEFASLLLDCLLAQSRFSAAVLHIRQYGINSESCAISFVRYPSSNFLFELLKQSSNGLESAFAVLESLHAAVRLMENDEAVTRFQQLNGSQVLDDKLISAFQKEKRQNMDVLVPRLQNLCAKLSTCGLTNIAARILLI